MLREPSNYKESSLKIPRGILFTARFSDVIYLNHRSFIRTLSLTVIPGWCYFMIDSNVFRRDCDGAAMQRSFVALYWDVQNTLLEGSSGKFSPNMYTLVCILRLPFHSIFFTQHWEIFAAQEDCTQFVCADLLWIHLTSNVRQETDTH